MGQYDDAVVCPKCGTWGAKKSLWKIKCTNPACDKFDSEYAEGFKQSRVVGKPAAEVFSHLKGKADPNDYSLRIRYQNFRGDEIIYSADAGSGYKQGEHLVIRVAPTGKHITFKLSKIQNRGDVDTLLRDNPQPSANERRVLRFHLRRGTSSPAFEELRKKYPNFQN